jgi:hypothetical protein
MLKHRPDSWPCLTANPGRWVEYGCPQGCALFPPRDAGCAVHGLGGVACYTVAPRLSGVIGRGAMGNPNRARLVSLATNGNTFIA